jgi:uncharacterized Tic20 family protein
MDVMNETQERERNSQTEATHKREVFWQITVPLVVGVILALTLAVLAVVAATGGGSVKQAGDAALMCLIAPLMMFTLIFGIIAGAIAFGLIKANQELPFVFKQVQDIFARVRYQVQTGSDKAVEPFLKIRSFFASIGALKRK